MSVASAIREKLTAAFAPLALEVVDDSASHAGHHGHDHSRGETHFEVRLVSSAFEGVSRVERQRRVYAILGEELKGPVHALSVAALTPAEAARA